ncbi:extensin family protein [Ancylobacter sp. SL191]|uniref:extensin-like domain-containing protein n=1 Tax=Ancylobacter sp. SL191 TaxID=2995166 RepID=UPI00226DD61D|nr:extensin family protein [Ancylobacter sp. SL191]WAC28826.1 extensin family protein [Ancylobacter sp. SL191]
MTRGVSWFLVAPLVLLGLSGCKFGLFDRREPWRSEAEERCLAGGEVKPSAYIIPIREIDGAGTCGMDHPFRVLAFNQGTVEVAPKATLACPMTSAVDRWMLEDIQPAAMAWFGQPVAKVKQMSSYSCRNMNGGPAGKISEHAFGNALDIGGFELADGRIILVKTGWKGRPDEQGFLRTVQATGCQRFTTTLGPGYNIYHYDHIHVDLMRRAGRTSCNPNVTPPRPPNLPVFKAPPLLRPMPAGPMANAAEGEAEPGTQEDFGPGSAPAAAQGSLYPAAGYPAAAPAYPAPVARAPAAPAAAPAPLGAPGEPMPLTPQPGYGATYGHGVDPNYRTPAPPPAVRPATGYPAQQAYPPQGYPVGGYPAGGYPGQPAPAAYPAQGYPTQNYPAQGYPAPAPKPAAAPKPAPATTRPPGVPLPPAAIPLAKWLGLDTTPTGSTGTASSSNVRSFTNERRFASPIPGPEAEGGTD